MIGGGPAMNQTIHELFQFILQGVAWLLRTVETLWAWSWAQIASVLSLSWESLPNWKLAVGIAALVALAVILLMMVKQGLVALGQIAASLWTIAVTCFTVLAFVVIAGAMSHGFQWVVASVPDDFWQRFM
jgi:hypothetical protein